jgi:hypothetical protein
MVSAWIKRAMNRAVPTIDSCENAPGMSLDKEHLRSVADGSGGRRRCETFKVSNIIPAGGNGARAERF